MIASEAAHPGCMYRWMNWALSPEANAQATIYFGEAPVSQAACDFAETWQDGAYAGHCDTYHATDEAYYEVRVSSGARRARTATTTDDCTTCKSWRTGSTHGPTITGA